MVLINLADPLTCRSLGKNVLQIAFPQSSVRMHAVVLVFQILREPKRIFIQARQLLEKGMQYRLSQKQATCHRNLMKGFGCLFGAQVNRENRAL